MEGAQHLGGVPLGGTVRHTGRALSGGVSSEQQCPSEKEISVQMRKPELSHGLCRTALLSASVSRFKK